jgi:hypothetical protein
MPTSTARSVRSSSQSISQLGEFVGPIPRALNVPEAFRPLTDTIVVRDGVEIRARTSAEVAPGRSGSSSKRGSRYSKSLPRTGVLRWT